MTESCPLDDLEMSAWHAMLRGHAHVLRRLEAELVAEHGLSLPAYEVLSHLSEAPGRAMRMTELSTTSLLSPSGVSRLVDKLQGEALVERRRCATDARVVYAELTDLGMARLVRAYPSHLRGVREHVIGRMDRDCLAGLASAMGRLLPDDAGAATATRSA